jgi:hypothetical protein
MGAEILVLLLDIVSTENCIFRNSNPKVVAVVGSGIQVLFMAVLLLVHLCIFPLIVEWR